MIIQIKNILENLNDGYPYRKYTKKYKCIFIHIPKTAGTSILKCLSTSKVYRDHATYVDYQRINSMRYERYFKFCFVRNPYDRAVSFFEYLKKGGNGGDDLFFKNLIENEFPTFERFILEYLDKDKIYEHVLFKPQYSFVFNHKGESQVDYIGRYENIKEDFEFVCRMLGLSFNLPIENRSERGKFIFYYANDSVKEKVDYLYSKDFELLNYPRAIFDLLEEKS